MTINQSKALNLALNLGGGGGRRGLMSSRVMNAAQNRAIHKNLCRQEKQSRSPNETSKSQEAMIFVRMMFIVLESPNMKQTP